MHERIITVRNIPKALLVALVFSIALWLGDFPKPNWDDLFYSGAGFHMAAGGDLSNPLLARQEFPSHYFFVYPPLQSYVLGGWLKLFGISACSATALAMANFCAICCATILLLRRYRANRILEWLVIPGALFGILPLGLRPEPLAVALAMCGCLLADWRRAPGLPLFAGCFMAYLAASAAPRVTVFAATLAAYSGWTCLRDLKEDRRKQLQILSTHAAALALAGLLFLWMIDFRVGEFWHTFNFHATRVANQRVHLLMDYAIYTLRILQWPLVLLPLILVIPAIVHPRNELGLMGVFVMAGLPLNAWIGGIGLGTLWWMILAMLLLAASAANSVHSITKSMMLWAVTIALAVADRRILVEFAGLMSGKISADTGGHFQEARALQPTEANPLLVDSITARYVYDYRIPAGCLDGTFASPFPGGLPGDLSSSELRPGDMFVAGSDVVEVLRDRTYLQQEIPMWSALGIKKLSYPKYPRCPYVFPATDCKGPRSPKTLAD